MTRSLLSGNFSCARNCKWAYLVSLFLVAIPNHGVNGKNGVESAKTPLVLMMKRQWCALLVAVLVGFLSLLAPVGGGKLSGGDEPHTSSHDPHLPFMALHDRGPPTFLRLDALDQGVDQEPNRPLHPLVEINLTERIAGKKRRGSSANSKSGYNITLVLQIYIKDQIKDLQIFLHRRILLKYMLQHSFIVCSHIIKNGDM